MEETIFAKTQTTFRTSCDQCGLSSVCLPIAVDPEDLYRLETAVNRGQKFNRGELVFKQRDRFKSCFVVQGGAVKTFIVTEDGEKQVTGFYLPGEMVALDSINTDYYSCSAEALERSSLCEIPLDRFAEHTLRIPGLQHHFFQLMSQEIQKSQRMTVLLNRKTADERLATFLLSLSKRFGRRHMSATQFRLPMTRNDIANHLGLAVETVSRVLTRLQKQKLVQFQGRYCTLTDVNGLTNIAHAVNSPYECRG
ncbi:fumarate/nitrate reduction transcriptional regulator Fnr [Marinobacter sp. CHS3-4]|uniref:fumarate/nitrate reduction transcriptional regulator Fnr n=1 Tax=Marinobacter sp. CHS3-4 TaxID=3045174 RepID=UPI0024B56486|nr:fumarate/nitrate reduction transcriptional regulator Fnr [Marinobacter sp. CHS3-4]MDI9246726.1 fumarate/nitrate reduction transcriptional regulator Fnr [Marinobacter sp. CHS3-4]